MNNPTAYIGQWETPSYTAIGDKQGAKKRRYGHIKVINRILLRVVPNLFS